MKILTSKKWRELQSRLKHAEDKVAEYRRLFFLLPSIEQKEARTKILKIKIVEQEAELSVMREFMPQGESGYIHYIDRRNQAGYIAKLKSMLENMNPTENPPR